jgi:hypothetical protein
MEEPGHWLGASSQWDEQSDCHTTAQPKLVSSDLPSSSASMTSINSLQRDSQDEDADGQAGARLNWSDSEGEETNASGSSSALGPSPYATDPNDYVKAVGSPFFPTSIAETFDGDAPMDCVLNGLDESDESQAVSDADEDKDEAEEDDDSEDSSDEDEDEDTEMPTAGPILPDSELMVQSAAAMTGAGPWGLIQPLTTSWSFQNPANAPAGTVNPHLTMYGQADPVFETEADFDLAFYGGSSQEPPDPEQLTSRNHNLSDLLRHWANEALKEMSARRRPYGHYVMHLAAPTVEGMRSLAKQASLRVKYSDLMGDECDLQGINWKSMSVTRREARARRVASYTNYVNERPSNEWWSDLPDVRLPASESFFRFRTMDLRRNVHCAHFQLRNNLACTDGRRAFYTGKGVVHEFDRVSGESRMAFKFEHDLPEFNIVWTLAAGHGILLAGGIDGIYYVRQTDVNSKLDGDHVTEQPACYRGTLTTDNTGITNHIHISESRTSSTPLAVFANNDASLRTLDIYTQRLVQQEAMPFIINCTATSPDKRLRVSVGDAPNVLITAADGRTDFNGNAEILARLGGHRDHGFACDWADDGWTVATAFQDRAVKIWDARRWTDASGRATPVTTIRAEMAGARSLHFSPIGSGRKVLVAAQEADFIDVIDAQTWTSKQSIDIFGEIAGVQFASEGQDLVALCSDPLKGGVLQLERCAGGFGIAGRTRQDERDSDGDERLQLQWRKEPEDNHACYLPPAPKRRVPTRPPAARPQPPSMENSARGIDWEPSMFTAQRRGKMSRTAVRRRIAGAGELPHF